MARREDGVGEEDEQARHDEEDGAEGHAARERRDVPRVELVRRGALRQGWGKGRRSVFRSWRGGGQWRARERSPFNVQMRAPGPPRAP